MFVVYVCLLDAKTLKGRKMKIIYDKEDIIRLCLMETKRQCPAMKTHEADYDGLYQKVTVEVLEPSEEEERF